MSAANQLKETTLHVPGDLTRACASTVQSVFTRTKQHEPIHLTLNLQHTASLDSWGIGQLLALAARLESAGGSLSLEAVNPRVNFICRIAMLNEVIPVKSIQLPVKSGDQKSRVAA